MALYENINFSRFVDCFTACERRNAFTIGGLRALFDYLNEISDSTGEPIELDVISLCFEYKEYANFEAFKSAYSRFETIEELQDTAQVIITDNEGGFIVELF